MENAYGLLRSPWNSNPTPYFTRCNTTYSVLQSNPPGCEWHFGQMKLTEWIDFGTQIQYRPHGKIHTMIAGVWGTNWPKVLPSWDYEEYNEQRRGARARWLRLPERPLAQRPPQVPDRVRLRHACDRVQVPLPRFGEVDTR